jgi:hypothetical protein
MKSFNQVITVKVSVDTIAKNLLNQINSDFKHRELIVESIIGGMLNEDVLGYLHNSLNGYTEEINFKVGDKVKTDRGGIMHYVGNDRKEFNQGTVKDIDHYKRNKLLIEVQLPDESYYSEWCNHVYWDVIPNLKRLPIDDTFGGPVVEEDLVP